MDDEANRTEGSDGATMVASTSDDRTVNNVMRHGYRVLEPHEKDQMQAIKDQGLAFWEYLDSIGASREPRAEPRQNRDRRKRNVGGEARHPITQFARARRAMAGGVALTMAPPVFHQRISKWQLSFLAAPAS